MDELFGFVKENLVPVILGLAGVVILIIVIVLLVRKRKPTKVAEIEINDQGLKRLEKTFFKKCRKCGGNVPMDDNICQNCGEIP